MSGSRYPIPAARHRVTREIERSRFITTVAYAPTVEAARAFIASVREEFSDATHNCWAYVVGPPGSTAAIGMSDDGEPHGTAGRPMLTTLLHGGVGDVAVVVTRYFGGIKLGTGGLVRAYAGCVKQALETLPTRERVHTTTVRLEFDYASITPVRKLLEAHEARVVDEDYGARVTLTMELPTERVAALREAILDETAGRTHFSESGAGPTTDVGSG